MNWLSNLKWNYNRFTHLFFRYSIEVKTKKLEHIRPDPPTFLMRLVDLNENYGTIRVGWIPNIYGASGVDFFVKYRKKDTETWFKTDDVIKNMVMTLSGLPINQTYEIAVVSVDGEYTAESEVQEIEVNKIGRIFSFFIKLHLK